VRVFGPIVPIIPIARQYTGYTAPRCRSARATLVGDPRNQRDSGQALFVDRECSLVGFRTSVGTVAGIVSGGIAGPAAEKIDRISVAMDSVRCLTPGNLDSGEQATPSAFAIAMSTGPPTRKSCFAASLTQK
jgi:hypothetical protein